MFRNLCYLFSSSDRFRFLLLVILMLGGSFVEMSTLGAVPLFVGLLMGQTLHFPGDSIFQTWLGRLSEIPAEAVAVRGGIALGLLFLFRTGYFMFSYSFQERILRNRQLALASRIFRAYLSAPFSLVRKRNSSSVLNNVANETERFINQFLDPSLNILRNSVVTLTILALLLWFAPVVSLLSFLALGLFGSTFLLSSNRWMKKLGDQAHQAREDAVRTIAEGVGVYQEATILGVKGFFSGKLHAALERHARSSQLSTSINKCLWPAMELMTVAVLLGTLTAMLLWGQSLQQATPTLALLTVCLARLKGCLTELMYFSSLIRYNSSVLNGIANELRQLEAANPQLPQTSSASSTRFHDCLQVKSLSFRYEDASSPVLTDISFQIPAGTSAAFVGPTGAGKSTMAELILGLLQPTDGHILADGQDISNDLSAWQTQIGFVPQDIYLLDDTLQANIALGIPTEQVNPKALQHAIAAANLKDFTDSLPAGLQTILGERGTRLSGGQRQRVGIARALYRNPPLLLLDEATSALDSATEASVVSAIEKLRGDHTLIIVAHRLSTIKACNQVFFFDKSSLKTYPSLQALQAERPDFCLGTQNTRTPPPDDNSPFPS